MKGGSMKMILSTTMRMETPTMKAMVSPMPRLSRKTWKNTNKQCLLNLADMHNLASIKPSHVHTLCRKLLKIFVSAVAKAETFFIINATNTYFLLCFCGPFFSESICVEL